MPSKFQHIRFSTKTIFHSSIHPKHHRDMLDARYCAKADEIQLNIEPNSVNDANVYEFTNTQFNFIVPFSNKLCRFSVYVQPNREAEYILLKTFDLRSNDDHPITYLLQMLKGNSDRIVDKKRFYQQIGFEMSSEWIPRIKRSTLAYQPTIMNQQTTVMRRIVQELGCNELEDLCNVCDMKFEMIAAHKAFNYSTFKMKANDNLSSQLSKCQYRMYMRQNDTVSDYKTSLELNHNDEIAIINRRHYVVEIKNQALFGFDTFMTLQTIYTKHEDYSNAFASSLRVQNDNQVILEHGSLPTVNHGVFDLIATASGYRVSNIRKYALLCAQTQLDSGKYYYEVHIKAIDVTSALNVRFGWSTTHFLSVGELNEKEKECGDGHHSWGWNGKTKHHGLQEDAKATIAAYGSQSAFIEDGDIIGCCIDIDLGQIRYYLDNQDLGVAFDNIRFEKAGVFPCVSYRKVSAESQFRNECAILDFEIVCEPQLFKCDAIPTGYSPIHCEDRNYLFTQSQKIQHQSEMLSSKYAVLHTETDSKQQLVDHSANIYQFDEIEHVQFIIPFIRKPANLGVYVQPKEGFKFMLIRKFRAKPIATLTTENQFYNEIGYLLTTLNHWKYQITNPSNFLQHVGVSLTENHADLLMQQAKSLSFPLIPLDAALTQRLVEELDIQCLSNYLKVLLSTFDVVGHAFDFCAIKMNPNPIYGDIDGSQLEWFERYQYKLRSNRDDVVFSYNDQLHIESSNEYHIALVANHALQIQTIHPLAISSSTSFVDNLVSTDDKTVFALRADNVDEVYHDEILNTTYLMVAQKNMDHKAHVTESDGVVYQFDDINQLRFIIPFDTETQHAHLYVKPKANFDFVLIKKFDEEMRQDITNKIDYVLTVLKDYDLKITNRDQFYECIGVTVQKTDIRDIQQSKLLYASTVLGARTTCLQRLVQELKVTELSNMLCVFELKMECVDNCKSFNCSIFQIVSNSGYEQKDLFSQNEYKLVSYSHADDAKDE
eukprot:785927_1